MNDKTKLAHDESAREKDENGYLSVKSCNISKACVNPYFGRTIPNYQQLGLDPDTVYMMYRDPKELAVCVDSFKGKPLLREHAEIDSKNIPSELVIGSIGTDVRYEHPYLVSSLTVWNNADIEMIEQDAKKELSCSYYYTPDMTSGEVDGVQYDGIMRNIKGNHVAVVERGRAGSDVAVSDSAIDLTTKKDVKNVKENKAVSLFKKLFPSAANDAKDENIKEFVDEIKKTDDNDKDEDKKTSDSETEKEKADDEDKDAKIAALEAEIAKLKESKANDSVDMAALTNQITKEVTQKVKAAFDSLSEAKETVMPYVGSINASTPSEVYQAAIKAMDGDCEGLTDAVALKAVFKATAKGSRQAEKAFDSADDKALDINDIYNL